MKKERQSNFELLRILLMIAIPVYHLMVYSGMNNVPYNDLTIPSLLICSGSAIVADYAFMAMSAYFFLDSVERPLVPRFLGILAPVAFMYVIKMLTLKVGLQFSEDFYLYKGFLYDGSWWFIKVYLIMLCLYPFLNKMIAQMKKQHLRIVCMVLGAGFLYNGIVYEATLFSDVWAFVFTYFVVAYLRMGEYKTYLGIKNKKSHMIGIYLAGYILTFVSCLIVKLPGILTDESLGGEIVRFMVGKYAFPQFFMGIAVFLLFRSISIPQNKMINTLAKNVFYVFLLHETVMAVFWKFGKLVIINDKLPFKNVFDMLVWSLIYIVVAFGIAIFVRFVYEKCLKTFVDKGIAIAGSQPFVVMWCIFAVALYFGFHDFEVNKINATMMAFSYKYGFVSRGIIGSIYQLLDFIPGIDMGNYDALMVFTQIITIIYVGLLLALFAMCMKRCTKSMTKELRYVIVFFTIWAVPMFVSEYNFGRLDIYCVMLSLLGAILLIKGKAEWLVVVFSALGVMVHQGNVFMFLNIILILLIYKALSNEGVARKKYIVLFGASFLVASVLFLYFEFFSHMNGADIYEEVVAYASSLRYDGTYHVDVVDKEILGIDLSEREIAFRKNNCVQFPAFIVLMLPYILLAVRFFKNVIKSAETKLDKCKYLLVSVGAATIIPDLLLKCDYGRWMFAIICYYCVITIALLGMKDVIFERELKKLVEEVTANRPWMILLLIYPILLQPLQDVSIIEITRVFARTLNRELLHWW